MRAIETSSAHFAAAPDMRRAPLLLTILLTMYGLSLNQTSVIFGVNLSIADPIAVAILFALAARSSLHIPVVPTLYFTFVSISTLSVSLFVADSWISDTLSAATVFRDYLKLVAAFASFVIGVALARSALAAVALRAFAVGCAFISVLAIVGSLLPLAAIAPFLYYAGFRFKGFMNDPNYFAVMAVAALAVVWRDADLSARLRLALTAPLLSGIVISGSKTGILALLAWIIWRVLTSAQLKSRSAGLSQQSLKRGAVLLLGVSAIALVAVPELSEPLSSALASNPSTARIAPVLFDFDSAVDAGGSSRDSAWSGAAQLIIFSPLAGVGVGSYLEVSEELTGRGVLAHNTYLQVAAEWGIPLAALLFVALAFCVLFRPRFPADATAWMLGRDPMIVLLVGSMGLSLNNSRLFWLLFGVVACHHLWGLKSRQGTAARSGGD